MRQTTYIVSILRGEVSHGHLVDADSPAAAAGVALASSPLARTLPWYTDLVVSVRRISRSDAALMAMRHQQPPTHPSNPEKSR